MLSLFIISIIASCLVVGRAVLLYRDINDRDLGLEEIITVSIVLGASINIFIDVLNVMAYPPNPLVSIIIKQTAVMSRLAEALICHGVIQYMFQTHTMRLETKEK